MRKAIRQALDPQFLVDTVFLGFGADVATGPVPQTATDFYTDDKTLYTFDTAAAEAALDAAGYPRGADGTRFSLRLRAAPFFPETVATGEYVKQALEEVGIAVEIVAADSTAGLPARRSTPTTTSTSPSTPRPTGATRRSPRPSCSRAASRSGHQLLQPVGLR